MTRVETFHFIVKPEDRVSACGHEEMHTVSLQVDNFPQHLAITLGVEHIPQVEQLLNLLWAMKDEKRQQEEKAKQQLETALKEAEAKQEYYSLTAEF